LDDCLATISLRKQKQSYCNTMTSAIDVVYARDCKAHYFVRLKKELKTPKRVAKRLQTKIIKNSTFLSKAQAVFVATIETIIANVAIERIATTIEEAKALQTQETKWTRFAKKKMFNENDDQQSSNLRLNYFIQVREEDYVSLYELEHLEVYRYVPSTSLNLSIERRRSLILSTRIYEHQYTHAKTQTFVNRLYNSYVEMIDETNM